jgi:hypothetical protein
LAAEAEGQALINEALSLVFPNAYPRYRDIGLIELAIAVLAVPDPLWVREQIQSILRVGLNREGVIFTFDLPSILLAEAANPPRAIAPDLPVRRQLEEYLAQALALHDRWGTGVRAQSAHAAALYWQGEKETAIEELRATRQRDTGFAGYAVMTLLALANRCCEFGEPELATTPAWGYGANMTLLQHAAERAHNVRNLDFQFERVRLVNAFGEWWQAATPNTTTALQQLGKMSEADFRRVYKDHVSARWVGTPTPATPQALSSLILAALNDGSLLDCLLGRLFGPKVAALTDAELVRAMEICANHLLDHAWETRSEITSAYE